MKFCSVRNPLGIQIVGLFMLSLIGCAPDTVTVKARPTFDPNSIKTIAVMPFTAVKGSPGVYQSFGEIPPPDIGASEIQESFTGSASPVPLRPHATKVSVPHGVGDIITEMVYANLKLRPGLKTYPAFEVSQALARSNLDPATVPVQKLAVTLGQTLSLDGVVAGQVRVYREREGQKYGAIPAAVGFDVQVISAKNGTVLWIGDYFEEQKPLIQDLQGFFERRGQWVTAEELARSGVKRVMDRLLIGNQ